MEYPIYKYEDREMVSERIDLLKYLIGKRVNDIIKIFSSKLFSYSIDNSDGYLIKESSRGMFFLLNDNSEVCFFDEEETGSLGIFSVKSPDGTYNISDEFYSDKKLLFISITDNKYSTSRYAKIAGRKIIDISIIQGNYHCEDMDITDKVGLIVNPSGNEYGDKVGVIIKLDNKKELVVFYGGKLYFKEDLPLELREQVKYVYSIQDNVMRYF